MLFPKGSITAELKRDGHEITAGWINKFPGGSGIIMEYDFDPTRAESIRESILGYQGKSLLLTSEFGYEVICKVLELMGIEKARAEPVIVKNLTFGGTIRAAGLLTVDDYCKAYSEWLESSPAPSQIIIPMESFNSLGFDLKHIHHSELQKMTGIPIILK